MLQLSNAEVVFIIYRIKLWTISEGPDNFTNNNKNKNLGDKLETKVTGD